MEIKILLMKNFQLPAKSDVPIQLLIYSRLYLFFAIYANISSIQHFLLIPVPNVLKCGHILIEILHS